MHREVDVWMPSHHVPDARRLPRSPSIPVSSRIFPRTTFSPGKGDPASTPVAHTGNMSMLSCHARGVHSCGETPPCSQPVSTLTCTSTHTNASLLHLPRISALSQLHAPDASGMVAATPKHTASLCRRWCCHVGSEGSHSSFPNPAGTVHRLPVLLHGRAS